MASTLVWGLVGSLVHISFFYLIYRYHKVITVVDLGWCAGFLFLIFLYLIRSPSSLAPCSFFFILCVLAWALRLAHHLEKRLEVSGEDRRYAELVSGWTAHKELYIFFFIFMLQGFLLYLVALPLYCIITFPLTWNNRTIISSVWWTIGFFMQIVADRQLASHLAKNEKKVLSSGLWKFSRHPNYFGESCMWTALALAASSSECGVFVWISPIVITFLLVFVSGIPLAEKGIASLPGAKKYIDSTSPFFPMPPFFYKKIKAIFKKDKK